MGSWSDEQVGHRLGAHQQIRIVRRDGKPLGPEAPPYAVSPGIYRKSGRDPCDEISIIDFSEASTIMNPRHQRYTRIELQSPETMLNKTVSQAADVWTFACTVFEIFNNDVLFQTATFTTEDVLSETVEALGKLPQRMWEMWDQRIYYFDEDGGKRANLEEPVSLATRIEKMRSRPLIARNAEQLEEKDLLGLHTLLQRCLKYEPGERATADDILKMDWIREI